MIKVGITGGIGSGKSYVCNLLKKRGLPIYNCDLEAKSLMSSSTNIRQGIIELVGQKAFNGSIPNKNVIAEYLFANKQNADRINRIVHPIVKEDFILWSKKQTTDIVIQECAILFESKFDNTVDFTVLIYAPEQLRIERAMKRDCSSREQIKERMMHQLQEEEMMTKVDFIIWNDGKHDLEDQINLLLQKLQQRIN